MLAGQIHRSGWNGMDVESGLPMGRRYTFRAYEK
jgi:hypothetical protein